MIAGHAFLTGNNPTPIPVVKSLVKHRSKLVLGGIGAAFTDERIVAQRGRFKHKGFLTAKYANRAKMSSHPVRSKCQF